jgi:phage-related protein
MRAFVESAAGQAVLGALFTMLSTAAPVLLPLAFGLKIAATALTAFNMAMRIVDFARFIAPMVTWAGTTVAQGARATGSLARTAARYVGRWAFMAAGAMARAAVMAASWVIAMGPVGWVIAAVVGLVALIIANWDKVKQWTGAAWDWVSQKLSQAWQFIKNLVSNAAAAVVDWLSNAWSNAKNSAAAAWDFLVSTVRNAGSNLLGIVRALPGRILSALGNLGSLLWSSGKNLILGLWNGIAAMGSWLESKVMGFIKSFVPGPVLDVLGISSPSKLFRDDIGRWVPEGLAEGIIANARVAGDAAREMAARTAMAARSEFRDDPFALPPSAGALGMPTAGGPGAAMPPWLGGDNSGATINVYNPQAERASDSLNREARTLEALGVL